ncbi:MAG: hypothetical protein GWM98_03250 [Nitrospinaceae bacterium]|nr:hypothetical protein [Nitrospinaceae bacterium]NIR55794.1 hypothetical protein [Nitrospinaceae bacterium]NIS86246.1 hypothetical protein [Nitrospinaceae bacterium]NIT80915.1 hypothetical protein [Nitrospinaceae bacterium]NIU43213.1 hypothetical protein [Nitrospinaceae bacterium]
MEKFLKAEYRRKFRTNARISVRKRQRFIDDVTRKISKKFGKDILCLVDFSKGGFVTLISPARTESTEKGKLYQSFSHSQVFYTSHCIERFSQRTETTENCILTLDAYMEDALLSFGEHQGYLTCPAGVFAYSLENDRLVVKTYINFEMLSPEQIKKFYGPGMIATLPEDFLAQNIKDSDFILADEFSHLTPKS